MRHAAAIAILLLVALASIAIARSVGRAPEGADASRYDYYVMALSWSPTWCRAHPEDEEQCGARGYGFVLHGLWPQYEAGSGPQRCASDHEVDRGTVNAALAFMPSRRLVQHEWRAHGTCSGLSPAAYFAKADRAFASLQVPARLKAPPRDLTMTASQLRAAFRQANPALTDTMFKLNCSRGELVEVRVCLDKDLAPRDCGKRLRNACPAQAAFTIPASR